MMESNTPTVKCFRTFKVTVVLAGAALGAALIGLLFVAPNSAQAAFPGANGKMFYSRALNNAAPGAGVYDIYSMNPDGTNQTNLTNYAGADEMEIGVSPDGKRIAFTTNRDGNLEIYTMNADGSNQTNITKNATGDDKQPYWSPDGRI